MFSCIQYVTLYKSHSFVDIFSQLLLARGHSFQAEKQLFSLSIATLAAFHDCYDRDMLPSGVACEARSQLALCTP